MLRSIVLVVLVFAAGAAAGAWYQLRRNDQERIRNANQAPAEDPTPPPPEARTPPGAAPAPELPVDPPKDPELEIVTSLLASIPRMPEASDRKGRITGSVRLVSGAPLAGATVRALPLVSPPAVEGARDPSDPEILLRTALAQFRVLRSFRQDAISNGSGEFELSGLLPSAYRIVAEAPGYEIAMPAGAEAASSGATIEFIAEPLGAIAVSVIDANGKPASEVKLQLQSGHVTRLSPWTPAASTIEVPIGPWSISAETPDTARRAAAVDVVAKQGGTPAAATLVLRERPRLEVRLLAAEAWPIPIEIRAWPAPEGGDPGVPDETRLRTPVPARLAAGATSGVVVFESILDGRFVVGAFRSPSEAPLETKLVVVGEATTTLDFALPAPKSDEFLAVRVLGPDGAVVRTASLRNLYDNASQHLPDKDGRYLLPRPRLRPEDAITHESVVEVFVPRFAVTRIRYVVATTATLEVRLAEPTTLLLEIAGAPSRTETVIAVATPAPGSTAGSEMASVDAGGNARIGPLEAGDYVVTVTTQNGASGRDGMPREIARIERRLVPGVNRLAVNAVNLGTLRVVPPPGEEEAEFAATRSGPSGDEESFSPSRLDGNAVVFDRLPEGTWTLLHPTLPPVTVRVQGLTTFVWPPRRREAGIRLLMHDGSGRLTAYGFRDRDLIVALDGKRGASAADFENLVFAKLAQEQVEATVRRGDALVTIGFPVAELFRAQAGATVQYLDP